MKGFFYSFVLIILILAELLFVPFFRFFGVRFNLILVSILIWFVLNGLKQSLIWLIFGGIILDIFSPLPFGVIVLSLFCSLSIIYFLSVKVFSQKNLGAIALIIIIGSLIYNLLLIFWTKIFVLLHIASINVDLIPNFYFILLTVAYNLVLSFFVYRILKRCVARLPVAT